MRVLLLLLVILLSMSLVIALKSSSSSSSSLSSSSSSPSSPSSLSRLNYKSNDKNTRVSSNDIDIISKDTDKSINSIAAIISATSLVAGTTVGS